MDFAEIRRLTIIGLFSDDTLFDQLVLKGGNAISLVYEFGGRASLDVDFSLENDFTDLRDTEKRIFRALERKFSEHALMLFDGKFGPRPQSGTPRVSWWGGYQFEFKLIERSKYMELGSDLDAVRRNSIVVGPNQQRRFTVDFSKYEYCGGKIQKELDDYTIYVYTPEMIVIEKLRAICQQMPEYLLNTNRRGRARDFYDIHLLVTASDIDLTTPEHLAALRSFFSAKDVPVDYLCRVREHGELHRLDWGAVRDTVASEELQDFEFYFEFVLKQVVRILKSLGIE